MTTIHLLYVDDEENWLNAVGQILQTGEFVVDTATDGEMALQKTAERMNAEALGELASAYVNLWREHDRLQHYIGLLDERQGRVLRLYYFESYVWTDVAKVMHMTVRTAQRIRQQAVDELTKLYAFADSFFKL